ncbi:stress-inducible protein [Streptomyces lincolnensis]|uniref:Stress-inducible protein n=1 Tax=Streptomyces lincolnensis TaxID=1915 RepID=A0A1B1MNG3_STRLN|nr:universal stress protein [Streptomyces lincolnensis]ANS70145.1 stress-inducible protein [Streptomyces lincolnensis]AXG59042.1 stress-inducible protein [Streptomyces lincolnensis]QMV11636.1 universal stress protein [Streptomyces lincolnensis]
MSRNVTAGLDGTPESLAAADWAAREALLRDLPLRLVHAWKWQPYTYAPLGGAALPAQGEDPERAWGERVLREAGTTLTRRHDGLRISTSEVAEEAVPALLAAAEQGDVLVLGSRGLGGVTGFLLGSVALAVVARADRPVVLVRAGESAESEHLPDATGTASTTTPYRDVVLGLDLKSPDDGMIEFAFDAAVRRSAALRVIHSWTLPPYYYGYGGALDPEFDAQVAAVAKRRLAGTLQPWREKFPGVRVTELAVTGGAGTRLVEASRDAALVVVGRKSRRGLVGSHIGPVTHGVLHHASAPVAVVPHD